MLSVSEAQLLNYKSVLYKKGIVEDASDGIVLALPRFKEFLSFMKSMKEDEDFLGARCVFASPVG